MCWWDKISYWNAPPHNKKSDINHFQTRLKNFLNISIHLNTFIGACFSIVGLVQYISPSSQWRHNGRDGVSNHQPHECLPNRLFRRRSKKTPKLRVTGLYEGNSPVTGKLSAQRASNAENGSIWWRHHDKVSATRGFNVILKTTRTVFPKQNAV